MREGNVGRGVRSAPRLMAMAALFATAIFSSLAPTSGALAASANSAPFYLAIGGSESVGVQPTAQSPRGQRTDDGYANDIVAYEASLDVTLDLHEFGCPGETTSMAIDGDDRCYASPDSQLRKAVNFLQNHQSSRGIVTIDLGFNDVKHCLFGADSIDACLDQQLPTVRDQLTTILHALLQAAGPDVHFIGLNHDDPYLGHSADNAHDARLVKNSALTILRLNSTLRDVYSLFDIPVANVAAAFSLDASDATVGSLDAGQDVTTVCELTWMCAPPPYGPNIHPNDAGYQTIARVIEPLLPSFDDSQSL